MSDQESLPLGCIGAAIGGVLIACVLFFFGSTAVIEAGHVGILTTWGRVEPTVLQPGFNFKVPIAQGVTTYDIRSQRGDSDAAAASRDLQEVSAKLVIIYHPISAEVYQLHNEVGADYNARVVGPTLQEVFKATTAQYTANDLIQKREEVKIKARDLLVERLVKYHIQVVDLNIVSFDFSKDFNAAIEAANVANRNVITAQQNLERQKVEAQLQIVQAEAYATATVARAEADAKANRLIADSITDRLITLRTLEKWNGSLPQVTGGSVPFVQVPTR